MADDLGIICTNVAARHAHRPKCKLAARVPRESENPIARHPSMGLTSSPPDPHGCPVRPWRSNAACSAAYASGPTGCGKKRPALPCRVAAFMPRNRRLIRTIFAVRRWSSRHAPGKQHGAGHLLGQKWMGFGWHTRGNPAHRVMARALPPSALNGAAPTRGA